MMSVVLQDSAEAYVAVQRAQIVGTILGTKETRFRVSNSGIQARLIDFEPPCRSSGDESAIRDAPNLRQSMPGARRLQSFSTIRWQRSSSGRGSKGFRLLGSWVGNLLDPPPTHY